MRITTFFHDFPLWAIFIVTVLAILLSAEAGYRVGNWRSRSGSREKEAPIGGLVGATLGLLAFLMAFTFSGAATRFDARRQMVLLEANALSTAYLRTDLLSEPERTAARETLVAYTTLRARGVTYLLSPEAKAETSALQDKLWSTAVAAEAQNPDSPTVALYVAAVNAVIDLDSERLAAGRNRIPDSIWDGLLALTCLAMAAVGYQFGLSNTRSWGEIILLVLAFALVTLIIVDLDRPQSGLIQVSQQSLLDLLEKMGAAAP